MLGWAQKWRRHGWMTAKGLVQHKDPWEQLLNLTELLGKHVKWLHTPSHIQIPGNTGADHLPDVGRRQSPLLFGQISAHPRRQEVPEADVSDEEWEEGCEGWEPEEEPKTRSPHPSSVRNNYRAPQRQGQGAQGGGGAAEPPPTLALVGHRGMHAGKSAQEAESADPPPIHAATVPTAGRGVGNTSHAYGSDYTLFRGNSKYFPNPPGGVATNPPGVYAVNRIPQLGPHGRCGGLQQWSNDSQVRGIP